jgi:hypothetical protein
MCAATQGHELAVKALLEGGADAGQSTLHVGKWAVGWAVDGL